MWGASHHFEKKENSQGNNRMVRNDSSFVQAGSRRHLLSKTPPCMSCLLLTRSLPWLSHLPFPRGLRTSPSYHSLALLPLPPVPCSLYTSFGFVPTAWVDPEWREDAEKSRVGKPRRILMVKPLRAGVLPPPVLQEGGDPVVAAEAAQQASKKSG